MRLQGKLPEIEAAGGRLAAISVDPWTDSKELVERFAKEDPPVRIGFPLLADPDAAVVKAYGVYDANHEIALPATIIVGPGRAVEWKHVGESQTDRPEEDEIVRVLRGVTATAD